MNDWKPLRAANRRMSLQEAYIRIEQQRDLLMIFLTSNKLLTQIQVSKIYEECQRMKVWLNEHKPLDIEAA